MIRLKRTKCQLSYAVPIFFFNAQSQYKVNNLLQYLGGLRRGEVKPGRNKVMLRHLGPVSPVSGWRHQTSWPELTIQATTSCNYNLLQQIPPIKANTFKVSMKWKLQLCFFPICDVHLSEKASLTLKNVGWDLILTGSLSFVNLIAQYSRQRTHYHS